MYRSSAVAFSDLVDDTEVGIRPEEQEFHAGLLHFEAFRRNQGVAKHIDAELLQLLSHWRSLALSTKQVLGLSI